MSDWGSCAIPMSDIENALHNTQISVDCPDCKEKHSLWTLVPPKKRENLSFVAVKKGTFILPFEGTLEVEKGQTEKTIRDTIDSYLNENRNKIPPDYYNDSWESMIDRLFNFVADRVF